MTARVLPVAPDGSVLLVREHDPTRPGTSWWGAMGGRIEPGEQPALAATRELFEESGITVRAEALSQVFEFGYESSFAGVDYTGQHTFFATHLSRDTPVSFEHLEPDEVGSVLDHGWWTPQALELDGGAVDPRLIDAMAAAVAEVLEEQ